MDWRRQAEDMAWFVASADGEDAPSASAYVGWHSEPGTGTGEAAGRARAPRQRASARRSSATSPAGSPTRACVVLETSVREDDEESLCVGRPPRLPRGGPQLAARARSDRRSRRRRSIPPDGVEIATWAERPDLVRAIYEVACEAYPDEPGSEEPTPIDPFEVLALEGHAGSQRHARGDVRRDPRRARSSATRSSSRSSSREGVALHDMTGVKRALRGRGIAGALKRAEIAWAKRAGLPEAGDVERGAERADPPSSTSATATSSRPARWCCGKRSRAGLRHRPSGLAEAPRRYRRAFSARSICRFASRSAIVRRLSPLSLPRPSATSILTCPFLK